MVIPCCTALVLLTSCQNQPGPPRQPTMERYVPPRPITHKSQQFDRLQKLEEDVRAMRDKNRDIQREIGKDAK